MKKLITPNQLIKKVNSKDENIHKKVKKWRNITSDIVNKKDNRLLVIVGPCSIHDTEEALNYAKRIEKVKNNFPNLFIVMRTYFEKPRTTVGWKGLINDPDLDGTFKIDKGLKKARKLLLKVIELGLPVSTEFLDIITPNYIYDLVTWGAIGARTTESQIHRELASNLKSIIGFKNATSGDIQISIDAIKSSSTHHTFLGVNKDSKVQIINSEGNKNCHIILRGGKSGPNYDEESIKNTSKRLKENGINSGIMIDASHGNSNKNHENQIKVIKSIVKQIEEGNKDIIGVMIESNIYPGNQSFTPGKDRIHDLKYGVSITDACVDIKETKKMLNMLNNAVEKRK